MTPLRPRGDRTLVMGVLNVTPDSFYDGGKFVDTEAAYAHAQRMIQDGADIIDVGGESSRPGADPVDLEEELRRVIPIVARLAADGIAVSVDTYRAETAKRAADAGAQMINDITAMRGDEEMAKVLASNDCEVVLMHMQGTPQTMQQAPQYNDVVNDIKSFLEDRVAFAEQSGIDRDRIWIDPGFGFGKTVQYNLELLKRLNEFTTLGLPILMGTSNKSTIGAVLNAEPNDRTEGTAATVTASILNGATAIRVHDVATMTKVARMTDAIRAGSTYEIQDT